jgi:hypothetical protein
MDNSLPYYQQKMEQFYDDLIDVIREKGCCLASKDPYFEDYIDEHDLLIFEDTLQGMEYDDSIEEILDCLAKKGYEIMMNFYREDVILGNVIVKLGNRWFAFGKCQEDSDAERYATEIWSLKYVLPRIQQMEIVPARGLP